MKITGVRAIHVGVELDRVLWSATHMRMNSKLPTRSRRSALLVEVETDAGLVGIGEAASHPGPVSTTKAVIEQELSTYLVGEDPEYIEGLWDRIYSGTFQHGRRGIIIAALSGIDVALWDLLGKIYGVPVYKLLGAHKDFVEGYASAGWYGEGKTVDDLAAELTGLASQGYRSAKIKICALSVREDLLRVAAARRAIGPDARLYVDGNRSYDLKTAMRLAQQLEEYDVGFFEEPISPDDVDGSARLAAFTSTPIAGYETEVGRFAYRDLIFKRAVDIVQADVIWSGGISECRKIGHMASAFGMDYVAHAYGSPLVLVANMHLMASLSNGRGVEVDCTGNPLMEGLLVNPPRAKDGLLRLPDGPGLGVELNRDFIEAHRLG